MDNRKSLYFIIAILIGISIWFYNDHNTLKSKLDSSDKWANDLSSRNAELVKDSLGKSLRAENLQNCLNLADVNYNLVFATDCKLEGNLNCDTNATLNSYHYKLVTDQRTQDKEFCFKQYPQN